MALIAILLGLVPPVRDLPSVSRPPDPRWANRPTNRRSGPLPPRTRYRHVDREPHPRAA